MIQTHLLHSGTYLFPLDAAKDLSNKLNEFLLRFDQEDVRRVEVHPHTDEQFTQYIGFVWINEEEPVQGYHGKVEEEHDDTPQPNNYLKGNPYR